MREGGREGGVDRRKEREGSGYMWRKQTSSSDGETIEKTGIWEAALAATAAAAASEETERRRA